VDLQDGLPVEELINLRDALDLAERSKMVPLTAALSSAAPDITCVSDCGEHMWVMYNWPLTMAAPTLILIVGGLIVARWRDLLVVATVGVVVLVVVDALLRFEFEGTIFGEPIGVRDIVGILVAYAVCLVIAAVPYGAKWTLFQMFNRGGGHDTATM
jgi:hypothetical protein